MPCCVGCLEKREKAMFELVDNAPSNIKEDIAKDEAEGIKTSLEEAGAEVELK